MTTRNDDLSLFEREWRVRLGEDYLNLRFARYRDGRKAVYAVDDRDKPQLFLTVDLSKWKRGVDLRYDEIPLNYNLSPMSKRDVMAAIGNGESRVMNVTPRNYWTVIRLSDEALDMWEEDYLC